ncbi:MAG: RsmD family RNA methyltransferase [Planctomycetes bacterium]|nr:RsmD family RNA methyltransferase [Planctomycetota bacterium]
MIAVSQDLSRRYPVPLEASVQESVFHHPSFPDFQVLDSGAAEKLERIGDIVLRRPDPQALWSRRQPEKVWNAADLTFVRESDRGGRWEARKGAHKIALSAEPEWQVRYRDAAFIVRPTPFKHIGLFPEQAANWELVADLRESFGTARPRLLNLFGYTGAASVLAARAGYEVTHVDASKTSIQWTRDNAAASGLAADALRVMVDDALAFARRDVRRKARYNVVLLDPPHYGRGPKGEVWQFEEHITPLIEAVRDILEERALVVLSTYAIGCSPLTFRNLLSELGGGDIESGELALPEGDGARLLPCGFCARFRRGIA